MTITIYYTRDIFVKLLHVVYLFLCNIYWSIKFISPIRVPFGALLLDLREACDVTVTYLAHEY